MLVTIGFPCSLEAPGSTVNPYSRRQLWDMALRSRSKCRTNLQNVVLGLASSGMQREDSPEQGAVGGMWVR